MQPHHKTRLLARAALVIALALVFSAFYIHWAQSDARSRTRSMLAEIAEQSAERIQLEVQGSMDKLLIMADLIEAEPTVTPEGMLQHLRPLVQKYNFLRVGLADRSGDVQTTDDQCFNISDRDYFLASLQGKPAVSGRLSDKVDGGEILVYSVPVYTDGAVSHVLFSTFSLENYRRALSTPTFDGNGFSYIVTKTGDRVVGTDHPGAIGLLFENMFDSYRAADAANAAVCAQMQADMAAGASGTALVRYGARKYIYYCPLTVNDWYLMTVVPDNLILRDTNRTLLWSYGFLFLCVGVVVLLVLDSLRARLEAYRQLERVAYVDALTGGDTFVKFRVEVARILSTAPAGRYAMISLDIDNFQYLNDVFGYDEGDKALCFLWARLHERVRENEACARVYGDHFVFFARYENTLGELSARFDALIASLRNYQPARGAGEEYNFSISVGVYPLQSGDDDVDTMMNRARIPQKRVKGLASSGYEVYTDTLHAERIRAKRLESDFPGALAQEEFEVYYQPKYDLRRGAFYGAEALVRWRTADGLLSPGAFISVLERNGEIVQLDRYMLEHVCRDLARWRAQGVKAQPVSVNVSRLQLLRPQFVQEYLQILNAYQLPAALIELEFTETVMVQNAARLTAAAEELHAHDIHVLIDDFGSGYSSLGMLKSVPLDVLKLDRSFTIDLGDDRKAQDIVSGALALAHTLGMTVTAEGVENEAQFSFLKAAGCDAIQGFYCAKPMPASDYEAILSKSNAF